MSPHHDHHDLREVASYPPQAVTLPLHPPAPVGDDSVRLTCPACLGTYMAARPPPDEAANYRCATSDCSMVIRVLGE